MKLLIRIPPTPRGYGFPAHIYEKETFDMLVEDQIIRDIPDWVKYSGLKQIELV